MHFNRNWTGKSGENCGDRQKICGVKLVELSVGLMQMLRLREVLGS